MRPEIPATGLFGPRATQVPDRGKPSVGTGQERANETGRDVLQRLVVDRVLPELLARARQRA